MPRPARTPLVRRLLLPLVAALVGASLAVAPTATATGGYYPSTAVAVAGGQTLTGGTGKVSYSSACSTRSRCSGQSTEYYRLPLDAGDIVSMDFRTTAGEATNICLLPPGVTDYTLASSTCTQYGYTNNKFGYLDHTAGTAGDLLFAVYSGDDTNGPWGYSLILGVQQHIVPTITLSAPKKAKVGKKVKITGRMTPAAPGSTVSMVSKSPAHGFQDAGTAKVGGDGSFHFKYLMGHKGPHQFKVSFTGGGALDQAQSAILRVKAK